MTPQSRLFLRQFAALTVQKNWIVLWNHWLLNLFRCLIIPIAFAIFLALAQNFLVRPNNLGFGQPQTIRSLEDVFHDGRIVWTDVTNGTGVPNADAIMHIITRSFSTSQQQAVVRVADSDAITLNCPSNFNDRSACFAALIFTSLPSSASSADPIQYTLRGDAGLGYVNVEKHTGDIEKSIMPLQWAIDSAIIELQTGTSPLVPSELPFTQQTNAEQKISTRKSFINGIDSVLVIAFWVFFAGVIYQMAGAIASERYTLLTTHLQAMGCLRSARIVSWHLSISLPYLLAWIIAGVLWQRSIFSETNVGLLIGINILTGLSLASWALCFATPFAASPQLAAICATAVAFVLAIIAMIVGKKSNAFAFVFTLLFPPSFFVFAIRAICQREYVAISLLRSLAPPTTARLNVAGPMIAVAIATIAFFLLAAWLEKLIYDVKRPAKSRNFSNFVRRRSPNPADTIPEENIGDDIAISVENLSKVFNPGKKKEVVALRDLTLRIPRNGIYVVLGSNGSGKSTLHGIIANIISPTGGKVRFGGENSIPISGSIGVVPQKNVLFPELTCFQTVRLWSSIKRPLNQKESSTDLEQLLVDCDLTPKIHSLSGDLSGGQKRKLQLAIGIVGGSPILMIDEATSGVDPLSRRAIWRALNAVRHNRTIIFTTHFLDEADLLGDDVAILAAPGKLLAAGSPVALKSTLGHGYTLKLNMEADPSDKALESGPKVTHILDHIRAHAPDATLASFSDGLYPIIDLRTCDPRELAALLRMLDNQASQLGIRKYDMQAPSLEGVFLNLMDHPRVEVLPETEKLGYPPTPNIATLPAQDRGMILSDARHISAAKQSIGLLRKRALVARRAWLSPLLALAALTCAACIPLTYMKGRHEDCALNQQIDFSVSLYLPQSIPELINPRPGSSNPVVDPATALSTLNAPEYQYNTLPPGTSFVQAIRANHSNLALGGLTIDESTGQATIAYETSRGSLSGLALLNLASNLISNKLRNSSGPNIIATYSNFPGTFSSGTGSALKWLGYFGLGIAVFPAFAALYVTRERASGVKAMQLSNGLTPVALHLGHLLAEIPLIFLGSTIVIVIWGTVASGQFADLGLMWFIFVLFGMAASLLSFAVALFLSSPLVAFALIAVFDLFLFILYIAAYLLTLTYAPASHSVKDTEIFHFTASLLGPLPSLLRAVLVSVNLFALRCDGQGSFSRTSPGNILHYGGPIIYLIIYICVLFGFLVWVDSGYPWISGLRRKRGTPIDGNRTGVKVQDVLAEERRVASSNDPLRVLNVSKQFRGSPSPAVDDVSFGVGIETLGLLGPNGAGKTTTFNIIRGGITADHGDVLINAVSINENANRARVALGLCPQFTAIDNQLTVREHLAIYSRLKGVSGKNRSADIQTLLQMTDLTEYADRLAVKLSGGNQRKLSLAIALMGNPSVLLIDEYSTGIDPATKRHMWKTLRGLATGKAVVITTHSMEEASALSDRVAILSGRLLAIGTVDDLVSRHPVYEVHVDCRSPEDRTRTQQLLQGLWDDCRPSDDVTTRWEIPVTENRSLATVFSALEDQGLPGCSVERLSLESVFLKTIRNNTLVLEE